MVCRIEIVIVVLLLLVSYLEDARRKCEIPTDACEAGRSLVRRSPVMTMTKMNESQAAIYHCLPWPWCALAAQPQWTGG